MGLWHYVNRIIIGIISMIRKVPSRGDALGAEETEQNQYPIQSVASEENTVPTHDSSPKAFEEMPSTAYDGSPILNRDTTKNAHRDSNPRLFGLLIGIDTYNKNSQVVSSNRGTEVLSATAANSSSFTNLRGAVADAEHFYQYLTSGLKVPKEQITLLCEAKATRADIIGAFKQLAAEDNGICEGDSIVIFYAGHGAQALPPKRLLSMNTPGCPKFIELLVPYDFSDGPKNQEDMGIPDYTLAALLDAIAKKKGNNITVIFDCCHSASALRGASISPSDNADSQPITRAGPELPFNVPDELDKDIWGAQGVNRGAIINPRLRHMGAASYVLFSACASFELAKEKDGRGYFTSALLALLQEFGPLPCSQIIPRLRDIDGQSPQCEGLNIDRSIFYGFSPPFKKRFFNIRPKPMERGAFILDAGAANGFLKNDEFTVYKSQSGEDLKSPMGRLVVETIAISQSLLRIRHGTPSFDLPSNFAAPALLTRPAQPHLQLYIDPIDKTDLHNRVRSLDINTVSITSELRTAHISLTTDQEANLRFDVVDLDLVQRGFTCARYLSGKDIDTEQAFKTNLSTTLRGLSHYYWHLKSRSVKSLSVEISFYELSEDDDAQPRFNPCEGATNLYDSKSGTIDLEVDVQSDANDPFAADQKIYGLQITNLSQQDLFPALFYFDNTEFTIRSSYQSPSASEQPESPLKVGDSMTMGYGVGTGAVVQPFTFSLAKGQEMDIGFLKLILSTVPIDVREMEQTVPVSFGGLRGMSHLKRSASPTWASFTVMVVQRLRGEEKKFR